jgi:hypothetical protein
MTNKLAMNFFKDGAPKCLRCYEMKRNPAYDRFTIVFCNASKFMGKGFIGRVYYVSANDAPAHPSMGFYQHGEAWRWEFRPCGSRVKYWDLPEQLREALLAEYCDVWGIVPYRDHYGNVALAERLKRGGAV